MQIGVIAEEHNDVEVLEEITAKIISKNKFSFKRFVGHGCGKFRRKCGSWAQNLLDRGCSHLVILHDLDVNDESKLRKDLQEQVRGIRFKGCIVLIPVHEIEAWLLADPEAICKTFNFRRVFKLKKNPELIIRPKEELRDLVWKHGQKRYLHTIHNRKIAKNIKIRRLNACSSFIPYPKFVAHIFSE
jgi:hypothetical protein